MDVRPAHAERDARAAIANREYRLWAVDGFAREVPGTKGFLPHTGYRVIPRTSDFLTCEEEIRFNRDARTYAEIYNRTVLAAAPIDRTPPKAP
ncbi:MAG: hypothetical protein IV086_04005 [Hyphomonadaceae bacterium]|nr:hypothetical protein [Hyphomonadaceae bacterium]